jgi:hypothetical protein
VVRRQDGSPVTKLGQLVTFVGTGGYNGVGTLPDHQADAEDTWLVMRVNGNQALIMKQNPIAVQVYGDSEARYSTSRIKSSVDAWWDMVKGTLIGSFPVESYTLPVKLNGEGQSSPHGFKNLADQSHYKSEVDPQGSVRAFVPSWIDIDSNFDTIPDVGREDWRAFVSGFSDGGGQYPNLTWLRSPAANAGCSNHIAYVVYSDGFVYGFDVNVHNVGVRPALWVRVNT